MMLLFILAGSAPFLSCKHPLTAPLLKSKAYGHLEETYELQYVIKLNYKLNY
jgi:hypothetical protein